MDVATHGMHAPWASRIHLLYLPFPPPLPPPRNVMGSHIPSWNLISRLLHAAYAGLSCIVTETTIERAVYTMEIKRHHGPAVQKQEDSTVFSV